MDDPLYSTTNDSPEHSHDNAPRDTKDDSHQDLAGGLTDTPHEKSAAESVSPIHESNSETALELTNASASEPISDVTEPVSTALNAENQAPSIAPTFEVQAAGAASEYVALPSFSYVGAESPQRRNLRNNLFTLLGLSLASFVLTAWVLVRVESPFGLFASGPRDVASAQLRALDRGEMRASYDMFSEQYRKQVTFDQWRQLVVTHWRQFHAEILGAEPPEQSGQRVTLEIHLRGADEKPYRARFTLIRARGRWWVDDLHWSEEPDERDLRRI
jgi:hypothetical protein